MTSPLRTVALLTLALLAAGSMLAQALAGTDFALGVVVSGLAMLGSLGLGALLARYGNPSALALSMLLKLPYLLGVGWLLSRYFPLYSVLVGCCSLIVAITLHAALGPQSAPRKA